MTHTTESKKSRGISTPARIWNGTQKFYQQRKATNTAKFNRKANLRRTHEKFKAKGRKRNR